jgi:hypothetical protein
MAAVDVNVTNTEKPGWAQVGIGVTSNTVTVQPNERKPITITIRISPDLLSDDTKLAFYFHTSEGSTSLPYQIPVFIVLGLYIIACGWILHQKGRSLWYLLLLGIFVPLWISNKRAQIKEETK